MPRSLKLPAERLADLKDLAGILGDRATSLAEAFKQAKEKPPITPTQFRETVTAALPTLSREEIERVMRQLLTLSRLRLLYQWTGEDVVGAVVAGNQEAKRHLAPIRAPLVEMLSSSALLTFTKTMDLTYEHDHLFESAKIITDIRPVFAEDASDIVAAVITYTLTLGYYSGGKYRRLSIAMDSKDLQKMGEQCARAEKKGVRVQALVQSGLAVGAVIAGHDEDDGDQ